MILPGVTGEFKKLLIFCDVTLSGARLTARFRDYVSSKAVHRRKLSGKLNPLPIPDNVAIDLVKEISLNWIAGLPESRKKNTRLCFYSILTIVDRLIKYALFIPAGDDTSPLQTPLSNSLSTSSAVSKPREASYRTDIRV